jgi:leader peptidase (prepilin peptidase) / N-methyltransferase
VLFLFCVFSFVLGLIFGSFLNVVIYRLPRHESLVRPGSHCPGCGTPIHWYDNIPLLSWMVLRRRCRSCGGAISVRYPGVELMTGVAFALAAWRFDLTWYLLVAWAFLAVLIAVALIDYDHMIIPSKIVLPGAAIGLAASVALHPDRWWVYLVASVGGAFFFFAIAMLWPGGGMGGGDVTMALFMGAVLGSSVLVAFFVAFFVGSVVGVYMMAVQKRSRKAKVPFGPFLAFGAVVALFLGEIIIDSYLGIYK